MEDSAIVRLSSQPLDVNSLRSRIGELRGIIHGNSMEVSRICSSEVEKLLQDSAFQIESKMDQILSDTSDLNSLSPEDLEEFLGHLKKELTSAQGENSKLEKEIEELSRRYVEDSCNLEVELEGLSCSLDFIESQGTKRGNGQSDVDYSTCNEDKVESSNACGVCKFKILELDHQIVKKKNSLKALQDLDCNFKRLEAIEKIEDEFSGLKVVEFEGNCIRLSLRTYMPNIESILSLQKIEDVVEPLEQNHELLIELEDDTMELKNVEIFPNDAFIGEIIDAAKSFRQLYSPVLVLETRSCLDWFIRRVQDRITISSLRRFVVKSINKSRHSLEYLDRDEIIIAHMVGGIDALIKVTQCWPISNASLELMTLKSSSNCSKEISLSLLSNVVEMANSLDAQIRQSILSFVDGIEETLMQQIRADVQPDNIAKK